jgi:hypothetical protein
MHRLIGWPRTPLLSADKMREFELHGVDALHGLLVRSSDGYSGTTRKVEIDLGNMKVSRGEIQDWLKWKAAIEAWWIRVGVVAASAAAIFSLLALLK